MRKFLFFIALGTVGAVAQASDNGFYLGGAVSQAKIDKYDSDEFGVDDLNDFELKDTAFKIIAGFRPLDFLAIEANYADLGSEKASVLGTTFKSDATAISAYALLYAPIPIPLIDVYGKVGVSRWELDNDVEDLDLGDLDEKGTDLAYGVGAQLNFGSLSARLEWEQFDIKHTDGVELLSLGLTYTFL